MISGPIQDYQEEVRIHLEGQGSLCVQELSPRRRQAGVHIVPWLQSTCAGDPASRDDARKDGCLS